MTANKGFERIYLFDILRIISAIFICLYHYTTRYADIFGGVEEYSVFFPWGASFVLLFFMLSGYLGAGALKRDGSPWQYAIKRAIRLYPVYWLAIALTTTVCFFLLKERVLGLTEICVNLTMLQEYVGIPSVDGAYWTLGVELVFYFWVFIILFIKRKEKLIYAFLGLSAMTLITNILLATLERSLFLSLLSMLFAAPHMYCFLTGVACYYLSENKKDFRAWALLALSLGNHFIVQRSFYFYLAFTAIMLLVSIVEPLRRIGNNPSTRLGKTA